VRDHVLEREEDPAAPDFEEARKHLRDLDACEPFLAALGIPYEHGEAEREAGDVGKRLARADGERGQNREDLLFEAVGELLGLLAVEIVDLADDDLSRRAPASVRPARASTAARRARSQTG